MQILSIVCALLCADTAASIGFWRIDTWVFHGFSTRDEYHPAVGKKKAASKLRSVTVRDVVCGGPAYYAGLRAGDRIVKFNGRTLEGLNAAEYDRYVPAKFNFKADPLTIVFMRGIVKDGVKSEEQRTLVVDAGFIDPDEPVCQKIDA